MKYLTEYYPRYTEEFPGRYTDLLCLQQLDEIFRSTELSPADYHHVVCSSAITQQQSDLLHFCVASVKFHDFPAEPLYEALLQTHLFLGFPAMIEALRVAHEICPVQTDSKDGSEPKDVRTSGENLCRQIYGEHYTSLIRFTERLHPELTHWMIEHGYGRVLGRPNLSPVRREIAILPILMITRYEHQLKSHMQGFINLGGARKIIWNIYEISSLFMTDPEKNHLTELITNPD